MADHRDHAMSALGSAAADYLAVRRALGYKLDHAETLLGSFVDYLDARGITVVTVAAAVEWATGSAPRSNGASRLTTVRCFARYLQALDPVHEVPPTGILPQRHNRPIPHLFTDTEINALMDAARRLDPPLHAATTETMIGLLAVTGMRIGEVLRLNSVDVDWQTGVVTVWLSKFNKSRHVPVGATTLKALGRYRQHAPSDETPALFVSSAGQRITYPAFAGAFRRLLDVTGITARSGRARIHLRHSFAVRTVLGWYRDGADVHALLPRLSTYLGHVAPSSTYWYLSAAPELMALAAQRLDDRQEVRR
ncbi:MAG: tyrosine-type recombinase/integrase [Ilumatobacteraceae bacterium]